MNDILEIREKAMQKFGEVGVEIFEGALDALKREDCFKFNLIKKIADELTERTGTDFSSIIAGLENEFADTSRCVDPVTRSDVICNNMVEKVGIPPTICRDITSEMFKEMAEKKY
ncbi:MAG: hypothetical protein DRN25_02400 [Thermoplasmata archaeon]|nr:MAG: hypothetical protein DRN25_02400 [Thermoplasmata archaeon]